MSKVTEDIKAGLKGIRGAGETIRGGAMEVTDELLDKNPNHPQAQASATKNQAIKEKGKQQLASADSTIGQQHGARSQAASGDALRSGTAAPVATEDGEYGSHSHVGA
ncbi:hypothetical protein N8I77_008871 [Diaporthe amygdali]|uniref:Uncharacterized protein n=1 Tax=Phomopsis amygdali TaxID=1214568 RepID=A0AAD9S901_PHOAM|nr:hypothetical protein N8I77_008871 [Diaporthe amygdali]